MTQKTPRVVSRKKLIEVALPLDAINRAAAHEKMPGIGAHPRGLHQWWSRKPLSAARALIFSQIVDDPSASPDFFPTERAQDMERQRLFHIIEDLVQWKNITNEEVLQRARREIWQSWRRACADNADHPRAKELFDRHVLPAFHDPFAGGGSLPLEAQRLGLEAHASDLNPVAVLINKAMIEIPPKFAGRPPVNPEARSEQRLMRRAWHGAQGLAEDVRYYGRWMRDEAEKRIGHLYPKVRVTGDMARDRPDLVPYIGRNLMVIAWLWARTVKSPNPAFADVDVPLASTFILSKKKGKNAYVDPIMRDGDYRFEVNIGSPPDSATTGTSAGKRRAFRCLMSDVAIPYNYIRAQGKAGRLGTRLMAIVASGDRERVYLSPSRLHETVARTERSIWEPTNEMPKKHRNFQGPVYGLDTLGDLFTNRQLVALTTLADLVSEAREQVQEHAWTAGMPDDGVPLTDGGSGATAYAEAVSVYLSFAMDRSADFSNSCARWVPRNEKAMSVFAKQAIPMTWDFAEVAVLNSVVGGFGPATDHVARCLATVSQMGLGQAQLQDAMLNNHSIRKIVSTDPPYFDNVAYADLSDFFYVWLRRSIGEVYPGLFATLATPKADELIAASHRKGEERRSEIFFVSGMTRALERLAEQHHPAVPITVYYAFKQSESKGKSGSTSTGWESFLDAVIRSGLEVTSTWPLRTEQRYRMTGIEANTLASSIVLACRCRDPDAPVKTRRELVDHLRAELPGAIRYMQRGNIAPADLAQASIGPGMRIYTRFRKVINADGSPMSVGDALALINSILDEVVAAQESDFDADTRWALTWFEQHGFDEGEYGLAEQLSKAKNTSVDGLVRAGMVESSRGKVRLLSPSELQPGWDPAADQRLTVWEMTHQLIRALTVGESEAADLTAVLGSKAETARDLAYRLYTVSERKRRAADALQYNTLVQSWPEIARLARQRPRPRQTVMLSQAEDGP